jgi:hypothetical protein
MIEHVASAEMYWRHPEDSAPPKATKILLYLNTGLALIGMWRDSDCLLWMPLPKVSKEMKLRLENNNK